ncbi:MAG: YbjN domain-containing protein [Cyanobacteriota bacterium]|nr:YbjN domain-containing protein [Cyanobacteriota bacterium]
MVLGGTYDLTDLETTLAESSRYSGMIANVVSSLMEDVAYENREVGHTWKFRYGSVEVFVHLSGESPDDTLTVWSPVLKFPVKDEAKLFRLLLEKNWSDSLEARFCIWQEEVVVNYFRALDGISPAEISRGITIVASLADEYDESLQQEFTHN